MNDLTHYLRTWRLSHPVALATTATARLYRVRSGEGEAVLKVFTSLRSERGMNAQVRLPWIISEAAAQFALSDGMIEPSCWSRSKARAFFRPTRVSRMRRPRKCSQD